MNPALLWRIQDSWEDEDELEEKKDEEKVETPKAKPKKTLQQKIVEKEVRGFPYFVTAVSKL